MSLPKLNIESLYFEVPIAECKMSVEIPQPNICSNLRHLSLKFNSSIDNTIMSLVEYICKSVQSLTSLTIDGGNYEFKSDPKLGVLIAKSK